MQFCGAGGVNRKQVTLGEVLRVKHGYAFKGEYFGSEGPYVLLTPGSFNERGGFRDQGDSTKYYNGDVPDGYLLDEGELLIAMTEQAPGLLGSSLMVPRPNRFLHNQRLGRIIDLDERRLIRRYAYYLFNTASVRAQISASATGGKVRHTAPERVAKVAVSLPCIPEQEKVADMLAAYDHLVENNRRRIALLGDAARQLYREWFVRLRFPGREHTRLLDGVPEGWERTSFDAALVLQRGFDLPTQDRVPGSIRIYGSTGVCGFHDQARVAGPGIVTGRSGSLGQVVFAPRDFWPLNTALWVREFRRVTPLFALHLMREMDLKQYNGGASVPTLDPKAIHRAAIVLPDRRLVNMFEEAVTPMFSLITTLSEQNEKLRTARDLLLPRLMSGELVV